MLAELDRYFTAKASFAFETTLSGRTYFAPYPKMENAGYRVELIFLRLNNAEEAVARVRQRVLQGTPYSRR